MFKKTETRVVHRGRFYFVIIRQYRSILGVRIWEDKWRETPNRFLSRTGAEDLCLNIKSWLKGKYKPVSCR